MAPSTGFSLLFLSSLVFLCIANALAQERAPHGLVYQNPIAFSPSAYDFFHPNARKRKPETKDTCGSSNCNSPSVLPIAAQVDNTEATIHSSASPKGGGVAGFLYGVAFAVLLPLAIQPNA